MTSKALPQDIRKAAQNVIAVHRNTPGAELRQLVVMRDAISEALLAERNRCLSILKSIEPMNPSEVHLIETIVRRIRGDE